MAVVATLMRPSAPLAGHDKQAMTVLPWLARAGVRYGGRALGAASKAVGSLARAASTGSSRAGLGTASRAPGMYSKAMERGGQWLQDAGSSLQQGGGRLADRWQGQALVRSANAARNARLQPPASRPPAGWGTRWYNNRLDNWADRGGMRPAIRGAIGFIAPRSLTQGTHLGVTAGLIGDRANHASRLEDAGQYGAARAVHQLRQNPMTQGMGALFASPDRVAQGFADKGLSRAAEHLRGLAEQGVEGYGYENMSRYGRAFIPGVSSVF